MLQATDEAKLMALITGLQPSDFLKTLMHKAPASFTDAMARANKHMDFQDIFAAHLHMMAHNQLREKRDLDIDHLHSRN